jgi:hypothetical protein
MTSIPIPLERNLPENELTNYNSLRQLIDKYNGTVGKLGLPPIDETLAEIRDALAHGRVSAALADDTLRLLKFSKPANGRVRITFSALLSSDWFTAQKKRVFEAMQSVYQNARL